MRRGKKITTKPKWFDLKKYTVLSELSANDWAYQLHHRAYLMECFSSVLNKWNKRLQKWVASIDSHDIAIEKWDINDESIFKRITENPILLKGGEYFVEANKLFFSKSNGIHEKLFQNYLIPLTCDRVFKLSRSIPDEIKSAFESYEIINSPDFINAPIDNVDYMIEGARSGIVNLTIDLNAYDDELMKNFKAYLKSARELYDFPEGKEITKGTLKRMNDLKILPYLDLLLWAKQSKAYISRETMGEWLFPNVEINDDVFDATEKIKTGTMPLATKCLNYNFISVLASSETTDHFSD